MENIFHSYTLDNLLLQPFPLLPPPSPSLSPLSPPLSFPSFLPLLSSLRGISELFPHEKTFPRAKTAITAASSHPRSPRSTPSPVRPPASLVPPETVATVAVPRPLSVEQIAAPSPTERRDQRPPSRLQIASCDSREKSPRKGQFCPPHSATDSRIPGRLGSRLPILPSG